MALLPSCDVWFCVNNGRLRWLPGDSAFQNGLLRVGGGGGGSETPMPCHIEGGQARRPLSCAFFWHPLVHVCCKVYHSYSVSIHFFGPILSGSYMSHNELACLLDQTDLVVR